MQVSMSEARCMRSGGTIAKQFRRPSTGEVAWVDVRRSWDTLYFRRGDSSGEWFRSASLALAAIDDDEEGSA